jgi:hypothetical protein
VIPRYWCGSTLSFLISKGLRDAGWYLETESGAKRLNLMGLKDFYENKLQRDFGIKGQFASKAEVDVFACRDEVYLCIEIKTRMYARIRDVTNDYAFPYTCLHSRYHFDRYPEAVSALLELKKNPSIADDVHETVKSSCELLRYCLGLIQAGYADKSCFIVVLMPFYAKEIEFETVKGCLNRLGDYVSHNHGVKIPMAIWKVTTDHLSYEGPKNVWIETVYQQKKFNISPPLITSNHLNYYLQLWRKYRNWRMCGECKYRKFCYQSLKRDKNHA